MICPQCQRNKKVTAYAAYVDLDESCRCVPQEDTLHVTGQPYPPIAYAMIAPPLAVQAQLDKQAVSGPPGFVIGFSQHAPFVPTRTTDGQLVRHRYAANFDGTAPPPVPKSRYASGFDRPAAPSAGSGTVYAAAGPAEPAAPNFTYDIGDTASLSAEQVAARRNVRSIAMAKGHIGEDASHNKDGLISTHLGWASATSRPGFQAPAGVPFRVRYLAAHERADFEVTIKGGNAMYRGRQMDTTGARKVIRVGRQDLSHGPMGQVTDRFIYVMGVDGRIYAADASGEYKAGGVFDQREFNVPIGNTAAVAMSLGATALRPPPDLAGFHHSSFLAGSAVACAGEIEVRSGRIASINNNSGHYRPPAECLVAVLHRLRGLGVAVERIQVGINMAGGRVHGAIEYFDGAATFTSHLRSASAASAAH